MIKSWHISEANLFFKNRITNCFYINHGLRIFSTFRTSGCVKYDGPGTNFRFTLSEMWQCEGTSLESDQTNIWKSINNARSSHPWATLELADITNTVNLRIILREKNVSRLTTLITHKIYHVRQFLQDEFWLFCILINSCQLLAFSFLDDFYNTSLRNYIGVC